jgi:hypothetical protein
MALDQPALERAYAALEAPSTTPSTAGSGTRKRRKTSSKRRSFGSGGRVSGCAQRPSSRCCSEPP